MKSPETLVIKKIFTKDGCALVNVILKERATPLNGFIALKAINEDGEESENTVYVAVAEIRAIEIDDEMQPLLYDFIRPRKIEVKD